MIIENTVHRLEAKRNGSWLNTVSVLFASEFGSNSYPLRFSIVDISKGELVIESTVIRFGPDHRYAGKFGMIEVMEPRRKAFQARPFGVVQIIPTGIGCEFGGYAGDAGPVTNLLASVVDFLVTHPSTVNASEVMYPRQSRGLEL
jgi:hypothetical protein